MRLRHRPVALERVVQEDHGRDEGDGGEGRESSAFRPWGVVLAGVFGFSLVAVVVVIPRYEENGPWQAVVRAQEWSVSSRIDGTVARVFVANGRFVRQGDLLAELDATRLGVDQAAARQRLTQGQSDLVAVRLELAVGEADLEGLRSAMGVREAALGVAVRNYLATRNSAGRKTTALLGARDSEKALVEALAGYLTANQAFGKAAESLEEKQATRMVLGMYVRRAEASLREINWRLLCTKILAPVEGRVVFDKIMFEAPVVAGKPFLKVVTGEPWVVADLDTGQLDRIQAGTRATITVDAVKAHTFYGKVDSVGSVAYAGRRGRPWWGWALPFLQPRETAPVRITFETDSLLGFEDRLEAGLAAVVQCSPELPSEGTQPGPQNHRATAKGVAGK